MDRRDVATINRLLAMLQERCARISAAVPLQEVTAAAIRERPDAEGLEQTLQSIYSLNQVLEDELERVAAGESALGDAPLARFYEREYHPNKRRDLFPHRS